MKPYKMTSEQKKKLLNEIMKEAKEKVDEFEYSSTTTSFSFEKEYSETIKDKILLIYEPYAWLKMKALVSKFSSEIGWYGLVKKLSDAKYYIYDVKICKQKVNGARVIDGSPDNEFYENLGDDIDYLHFQAHSHVNMGTQPSGTDTDNQVNTIQNMGGEGFFIFQIWNKQGEINTFLYDLDKNLVYDRNDIEISVGYADETLSDFIEESKKLVSSITYEKKTYEVPDKELKKTIKLPVLEESSNGFYWTDAVGRWISE